METKTVCNGDNAAKIEHVLRDRISRHKIAPGAKLREVALADEFSVSRARVRLALQSLEGHGLVEHTPNRGFSVRRLDAAELFQLYDTFEVLEGLSARLAVENAPGWDWAPLADAFGEELEERVAADDFDAMFDAVMFYRQEVNQAAANRTLDGFLMSIYDRVHMIIRRTLLLPGRARQSLQEHRLIISAIQNRDGQTAEELKRRNMRSARQQIREHIDLML
ncbi:MULTISPECIES: GntR family transcriptional regulator [unclassified Roseovarius]|uniref:GntR family transcriptional regulator n=1 Tax=unclassified Roseovarius TaxID=2614913 RepID=UPI00273DDBEE|nr:GntR family transcriptional regulator [Roseovarius sp. MMSF_3350]